MKNSHKEAEIKLQLTESEYNQFKKKYSSPNKGVVQNNYFFDTDNFILLQNKWVLRIRIEDSARGYMTMKGPGEIVDGMYIRPEYELSIPLKKAESYLHGFKIGSVRLFPGSGILERFGNLFVNQFLFFRNLRVSFPWKKWVFELDKTVIMDQEFYELEVETEPEKRDLLINDLMKLFKDNNWTYTISPVSKFKRALSLLRKLE